jgi:GrpB-like predicted nucleotidyltransferase (UPF0157 family)
MASIINVVDYNPDWPLQFQDLKTIFNNALGDNAIAIEHIGSTSVPDLAAKPILDIDIIVKDEAQLNIVIPVITLLGYKFVGDLGIKDRYAFNPVSDLSPYTVTNTLWSKHHLYCCIEGSLSLDNHLLFRNALRNSPTLAFEYGELKKRLASVTTDIDVYIESKSSFIAGVLKKAGLSSAHVKEIFDQNKKK